MANHWRITFDPLGLFEIEAEIASRESDARTQGEDVLQLEVRRPDGRLCIVDLGWYRDRFVVVEVEDSAWDEPSVKVDCRNLVEAIDHVRRLVR